MHCEAVSYMNMYNIIHLVVWVFINCKCLWVFKYIYVCVFVCAHAFLSVCWSVCVSLAAKNVCVEETEEAEKRYKSETASKQPAVATVSVSVPSPASLPSSFTFHSCA